MTSNPFVYGEVVPAASFVDRETELDRLTARSARGAEDLPDLAPPLRQVLARAAGAARRGTRRARSRWTSPSAATARTSRSSRATRARCCRSRRASTGPAAWLRDMLGAVRHEVRVETGRPRRQPAGPLVPGGRTDRDVSRVAQEVFALPGRIAEARRPPRSRSRSTSSRRSGPSTAAASSTRCARRSSTSVRSGTSSRGPSRASWSDARPEPAVLQGGPGHAAAEDSRRSLRGVHRGPVPRHQAPPGAGPGRRGGRARRQSPVRRTAPRARGVGRCPRREGGRTSKICTGR